MNFIIKPIALLCACLIFSTASSQKLSDVEAKDFKKCIYNEENKSYKYVELKSDDIVNEQSHLEWLKMIHTCGSSDDFALYEIQNDELGLTHYRYKQTYSGLPVEFSRYYVHVSNQQVHSANGDFYPNIDLSTNPQISKLIAFQKALEQVDADQYAFNPQEEMEMFKGELVVLPLYNSFKLAFKFDVYALNPLSRQDVYIDASSAEHLLSISQLHFSNSNGIAVTRYSGTKNIITDSLSPTSFVLYESGRGNGIETKDLNQGLDYTQAVDFMDADNYWDDTTNHDDIAGDVHWGMESTFDYFYNKHNRYSYDGGGSLIRNFVHAGNWLSLSFWDGIGFYFGDGDGVITKPFGALDIVAHEFTHAVIDFTASLTYLYEAGALQESFADIFGVCVDYYKNPILGDFLMGEDITVSGQPMRNLASPKTKNQPDTYMGQYWNTNLGYEWVNSGVQNYWFFLMCSGDNGVNDNNDTFSITGIGIDDASKIVYRSLSTYLSPLSDYDDARFASIQSAIDLFGSCSPQVKTATQAWWAVGVGNPYQSDSLEAKFSSTFRFLCKNPAYTSFINNSTNASNYLWDFGDNTSSSLPNPAHTYADTGYFTVSLSVWDTSSACGYNDTDILVKTNYIYVKSNATVDFEADLTDVYAGCETVMLTDLSDSCVQGWTWEISPPYYKVVSLNNDFPVIEVRFDSAGQYSVKLIVDFGLSKDSILKSNLITVKNPTSADFEADIHYPRVGIDTVTFNDLNPLCAWQRNWTITPSSYTIVYQNSDKSLIRVIFDSKADYDIKLSVSYGPHTKNEIKKSYIHALQYCTPTVNNINQDIGISYFELGDISNSSTIGQMKYNDFTRYSTRIAQYDTLVVSVKRNTTHNAMNRKIWIDYNMDGDFTDPGEEVSSEASASTANWKDTFYVPGTTQIGNTILRIGTSLMNMSNSPCGPNSYGEFEDYRLYITEMIPLIAKLKSQDSILVDQCTNYVDSGYKIVRLLNPPVQVDTFSNLNTSVPGQYYLSYKFTDYIGFIAEIKRTIFVVPRLDITTEFYLLGKAVDSVDVFSSYADPGYQINLNCNIINSVSTSGTVDTSKVGSYTIYYYLLSHIGQKDTVSREVHVVDNVAPIISLIGYADTTISVYSTWTEPGLVITDNYYTGLSPVIVGHVETDTIGDYTIYYSATDPSGNFSGIVTRMVHVVDNESPKITSSTYTDGDTVFLEVFATFYNPSLTVTDNYFEALTINITGTYISTFGANQVADLTGCYSWNYEATDVSANTSVFHLIICVEDHEAPVITLHGNTIVNLASPKELENDSFSVSDNYDQNITVVRSGTYLSDYLINHKLGFYNIHYDAEDQAGNKAVQQTRYINVDKYSNLDEEMAEAIFSIYPNPNKGQFQFLFGNDILGQAAHIRIYNALGACIFEKWIKKVESNSLLVDLENISSGLYYPVIKTHDREQGIKLIITN